VASATRFAAGLVAVCLLLVGVLAVVASASASHGLHVGAPAGRRHVAFSISSPLITESSSLVVSTVHPGLLYTANDSGHSATVYVLDASDGKLVGQTSLSGVTAIDIEAMAVGADGTLVVGDIGDNTAIRPSVALYRMPQPGRGDSSVVPDTVTLTYPGGPRDAESLLYDSRTGRVFVASKLLGGAKVYRSPPAVFSRTSAVLQPVADAPAIATDATFLDGYRYAMIRSYFSAVVYRFPSWRKVASFDLPIEQQGESLAGLPGGKSVLIGSEGVDSKVLRVRLPDLRSRRDGPVTRPGTVAVTRSVPTAASRHQGTLRSIARLVVEVAAVGVALALLTGLVLHRRS
jgi:hypothetical protein